MTERVEPSPEPERSAGQRAAKNTGVRAAAEIVGKLATFVLFAALSRAVGQEGVGAYVVALAFLQIATIPIGLGADPYLLREVARDRAALPRLFYNILGLKLIVAGPVVALTFVAVNLIGYDARTRDAVYVLSVGVLLDLIGKTFEGVFNATERGELLAFSLVLQRLVTAAVGLAALAAGYGVVAVAASYSLGAALGVLTSGIVLWRYVGVPRFSVDRRSWRGIAATSFPFAVQDVLNVLLFRFDAVLLSLLATQAAVGRYGAAYRLLDSTLFVSWALHGAFSAMYAYLDRDSRPSVGSIFRGSVKVALVVLIPCGVAMGVLAEPICRFVFGADFVSAAAPLRLLAPVVVLLCLVTLSASLIASRLSPRVLVRLTTWVVALNVVLNLVLIPPLDDSGAALAMLITEAVFVTFAMRMAAREVGGLAWAVTAAAPAAAGFVMGATMVALLEYPVAALGVGLVLYGGIYVLLERRISPGDLEFVKGLLRRGLRAASF